MKKKKLLMLIGSICLSLVLAALLLPACAPAVPEAEEIAELEAELKVEKAKVSDLEKEVADLEKEVAALKKPAEEVAPKVIKLATIEPITGACAPWGLPCIRGLEIWVDKINAEGGRVIGGERYMFEAVAYDNPDFTPSSALTSAKKAALVDGVKFFHSTSTTAVVEALGPFFLENDCLLATEGAGFGLRPEWPHVIGGYIHWPQVYFGGTIYATERYPEIKTAAILVYDEAPAEDSLPWIRTACKAAGWDIVFEERHPIDLIDFYPLMTAVLATDPDVIYMETLDTLIPAIMEAARTLGYTGEWFSYGYMMSLILEKVPAEYVEGAIGVNPDYDDPSIVGEDVSYIYSEYIKKWPGEWLAEGMSAVNAMATILKGMELADSVDPIKVREALLATDPIEHPILGESHWGGKEVFGVDNMLMTRCFYGEVIGGEFTVIGSISFADWYDENVDIIVAEMEASGKM